MAKNSKSQINHHPAKLAIGVSGGGTTFEAIAKAIKEKKIDLDLCFIFSDRDCAALEKAQNLGIKFVQKRSQEDISEFHKRIVSQLTREGINFVVLAGYLRLFPITKQDPFLVINSHPGAVPHFGGEGMWGHFVHESVIDWAKKTKYKYPYTFSSVHIATDKYDEGPVIGIKKCRILKSDNHETLAKRLLPIEHQNYIEVLTRLSQKNVEYFDYPEDFLTLIKKSGKI